MKMIQLKKYKKICLGVILMLSACDSFVEVDLPMSQLTNTSVFDNEQTANAALMDIYAKIRDNGILTGTGLGISNQLGNYTDELDTYGNPSGISMPFYNNTVLSTNTTVAVYWNATYNQIFAANALLQGTEKSKILVPEKKKLLQGEALFIRALCHFYLVNLFGEIPYIKETDYQKNSTVARMPLSKIYENIIADLQNAILLLPETYSSIERVRPNRLVCKALLSRVYLFNKSYPQAANEASAVLNQTGLFSLEKDLSKVFLLSSIETIWQLQPAVAGQNTQEGSLFIFSAGPPSLVALNAKLVGTFENNDLRKTSWIRSLTSGNSIWYHAFKYKEQNNTAVSKEYSIVFRLAEQYLIRAEARAEQGDLIGAKEDLNKIRNRAGLPDTSATTVQEILNAILQERKWELFTEQGHRFFDLKRSGRINSVLQDVKPGWNPTDTLLPIPQNELSTNPNLGPQNPGY